MPESGEMKKLKEHFADANRDADKVRNALDIYFLR